MFSSMFRLQYPRDHLELDLYCPKINTECILNTNWIYSPYENAIKYDKLVGGLILFVLHD
jgi:hypothetical protein